MYNNALCGVSASGDRFFYVNRLASAGDGRDTRWERASLECCPPNLVRFLASMPGYIYAQEPRTRSTSTSTSRATRTFTVGGKEIALSVESEMPWGGKTTIIASASEPVRTARSSCAFPAGRGTSLAPGRPYCVRCDELEQRGRRDLHQRHSVSAAPDRAGLCHRSIASGRTGDRIERRASRSNRQASVADATG